MKRLAVALALLLAASAYAGELQTVLTPDSTFYSIDGGEHPWLELSRRSGDVTEGLIVPGTDEDIYGGAKESDARLLWDNSTSTLYILWHSAADGSDSIMLASLRGGTWSQPMEVVRGAAFLRLGLQTTLTRAAIDENGTEQATLIHAVWWSMGAQPKAEYALIAYEAGQHVSTAVSGLEELAGRRSAEGYETEDVGAPAHPPLAMARTGSAVDVVFGAPASTRITRVRVDPRKVQGDARMWKPSGRSGADTSGPARMIAASSEPVQAFISGGRIVLYHAGGRFRYVVLDNGQWTTERMIQLDERVTSDQMLRELHRTVDELGETDAPEIK
jgi:hypothetical protein